ncbi:MAG: hypothetical protein R3255_10715 [Candidatus Lokiarchaeia archaeon]|nr:hypothetical protein [Candidatus Lokiarchaeia archaeon]
MINIDILNNESQIFYLSRESCKSPIISDFIRITKKLEELNLDYLVEKIVISIKNGKRMIINGLGQEYQNINYNDIIEIVDYDPIKNTILVLGKTKPLPETTLHWIIQNARDDINAIIQINVNEKQINKLPNLPKTNTKYSTYSLEFAKEILPLLRNNNIIIINNQTILFVDRSLNEVEKLFFDKIGGLNEG